MYVFTVDSSFIPKAVSSVYYLFLGRGWDAWMASLTWWPWVWAGSRSWWWAGKLGVLQSRGSQRVRHDWVTELKWKYREVFWFVCFFFFLVCVVCFEVNNFVYNSECWHSWYFPAFFYPSDFDLSSNSLWNIFLEWVLNKNNIHWKVYRCFEKQGVILIKITLKTVVHFLLLVYKLLLPTDTCVSYVRVWIFCKFTFWIF